MKKGARALYSGRMHGQEPERESDYRGLLSPETRGALAGTNYKVLRELLAFATYTEGDLDSLTEEEVHERLRAHGIDPEELATATKARLEEIRSRMEQHTGQNP